MISLRNDEIMNRPTHSGLRVLPDLVGVSLYQVLSDDIRTPLYANVNGPEWAYMDWLNNLLGAE